MAFSGLWKTLKSFVPQTEATMLFPLDRVIDSAALTDTNDSFYGPNDDPELHNLRGPSAKCAVFP